MQLRLILASSRRACAVRHDAAAEADPRYVIDGFGVTGEAGFRDQAASRLADSGRIIGLCAVCRCHETRASPERTVIEAASP